MYSSSDSEMLLAIALLAVAIGLFLVLVPSPQEKASWQQREFSAPASKVLTVAISYLQDLGYPIDTIDRESGFVKTQYAGRAQLQGALGVFADLLVGKSRYAATIQVSMVTSNTSHVRINLVAEQWSEGSLLRTGHWSQDPLAYSKADYDRFFNGLERRLGLRGVTQETNAYALLQPSIGAFTAAGLRNHGINLFTDTF